MHTDSETRKIIQSLLPISLTMNNFILELKTRFGGQAFDKSTDDLVLKDTAKIFYQALSNGALQRFVKKQNNWISCNPHLMQWGKLY
jgi:hypothetical protein